MAVKYILFVLLFSCGSLRLSPSHEIEVISTPSADLYLIEKNGNKEKLGTTPFKLSSDILNGFTQLQLVQKGYALENIYLDNSNATSNINVKLTPLEWWNDPNSPIPSKIANNIGNLVKNIYRYMREGKINQAQKDIETYLEEFPKTPFFYDLLGSISILKGDFEEAKLNFEKSLSLDANNQETQKTLNELNAGKYKR